MIEGDPVLVEKTLAQVRLTSLRWKEQHGLGRKKENVEEKKVQWT